MGGNWNWVSFTGATVKGKQTVLVHLITDREREKIINIAFV